MRGKQLFLFLATLLFLSGMATVAAAQVTVPYFEDFDGETNCGTGCTSVCTLTNGWTNQTDDDKDWAVDDNGTGSSGTGPSGDHTSGTGKYLYTEATACFNQTAHVITPPLDLTTATAPGATFWYHQLGDDMGTLHVDVLDAALNVIQLDAIPPVSDNVDLWQETAVISLTAYVGQTVHLRIRGMTGPDFESDMAIDDFSLFELPAADVGVISVDSPVGAACGLTNAEQVTVTVANFGAAAQSNIDILLDVDGVITAETVPGPLPVNSTLQYTFTATADLSALGPHVITASTALVGDANAGNDTASAGVEALGTVNSFPFLDDLEGATAATDYIHGGAGDEWELGTPTASYIDSPFSGVNVWGTDISSTYSSNADNFIQTAFCFDLSGLSNPAISVAVFHELEPGGDGVSLQASIDNGASWLTIGSISDGANWYNDGAIAAAPGGSAEGWSNDSPGWAVAVNDLSEVAGQSSVLLRFAFASNGSFVDDGFAWDDLQVFDSNVEEVQVTNLAIASPFAPVQAGTTDFLVQGLDLLALGTMTQDITSITVTKAGNVMDADLTAKLYLDDGDGFFDPALDLLIDTQAFAAGTATFNTMASLGIPAFTLERVFVAYDIAATAMPAETFGSTIAMPATDIVTAATVTAVNPPLDGPLYAVGGKVDMLPFTDDFSMVMSNVSVEGAAGGTFPLASMTGGTITTSGPTPNDALFELLMSSPDTPLLPVEGTQFFALSYPNGEATGALDYSFDLSAFMAAADILWLQYRFADTGEENDDTDNIFISVDGGGTWAASMRYFDWSDPPDTWILETIDVSAALMTAGVDYTNDVKIRFQASDDFDLDLDGLALDRVSLGRAPRAEVDRMATVVADEGTDMLGQIGAAPQSFMYTITNLGDFDLPVDETSFAFANDTNVTNVVITPVTTNTVAPQGTATFQVDFEPGVGAFSFDVTFLTDDPYIADNTYNFTIGGEGLEIAPEIDIQRPAGTSIADGMTDPQGDVEVGMSQSLTYTIENVGFGADLNVSSTAIANATNVTAQVDTEPAGVIAPGMTSEAVLSYAADGEGAWSFDLVVTSDDSDEGTYTITIDGTATDPNPGTGGGGGTGGMGGSPTTGGGGTGGEGGTGTGGGAEGDGGCGCSTPGSQDDRMGAAFGLWLLGLAFASRRNRRRN